MKPIRLTQHALDRCRQRGATELEIRHAIERGTREIGRKGRTMYRMNTEFNATWGGKSYAVKQVAPVVIEEQEEIVVASVRVLLLGGQRNEDLIQQRD